MKWFKRKEAVDVGTIVSGCNAFRKKLNPSFKYWQFDDTMVSFQLAVYVCALFAINKRGNKVLYEQICTGLMGGQTLGKLGDLLPTEHDLVLVSLRLKPETPNTNWAKDLDGTQLSQEICRRTRAVEMPIFSLLNIMVEIRQKTIRDSWLKQDPVFWLGLFFHVLAEPATNPFSHGAKVTNELQTPDMVLYGEFFSLTESICSEIQKSE